MEKADTVEAVQKFYAFADIILDVNWGDGGPPEKYKPEWIVANLDKVALFVVRGGANNEIIAGSMIRLMDEEGMGDRKMPENFSSKKMALLEYTAVDKDHRRQGIQGELSRARQEWARKNGVEGVVGELTLPKNILKVEDFEKSFPQIKNAFREGVVGVNLCVIPEGENVDGLTGSFLVVVRPFGTSEEGLTSDDYQKMGIVPPSNKRGDSGLNFSTLHEKDPEKVGELLKKGYFLTGLTIKNDIVHYVLERRVEQNTQPK